VNTFDATVEIGRGTDGADELVSANSMLAVTGLNVTQGESVRLVAEGPDAAAALDAVATILTSTVEDEGEAS